MDVSFAAIILTHGRPDRVRTYDTLRKGGYTGRIILLVDDEDPTLDEYRQRFDDEVVAFSKAEVAKDTDPMDNFGDLRSVLFARNATFGIARDLGLTHFVQLDDDYSIFHARVNSDGQYVESCPVRWLDTAFELMVEFLQATPARSIAFAQGGDMMGGIRSTLLGRLHRKCMNSFFCAVDRPFKFQGMLNDDVNTYTLLGSQGVLFMTVGQMHLVQIQTQSNQGGLTDIYLDHGTYVKSFYSVMACPSAVKVGLVGTAYPRLHHATDWNRAVPRIVSEDQRRV